MDTPTVLARAPRLRELAALLRAMTRFWLVVLPSAHVQLRRWERAASAIPDLELRTQALDTLRCERLNAAGAALFAATATRHSPPLVRALVAFQVAWDYLDTLAEQPAADPLANGVQMHRALVDAVGDQPVDDDYYRFHRAHDDGGYLLALVHTCRESCAALPAYAHVRAGAIEGARRAAVQGINHAPAEQRETALRQWIAQLRHGVGDASPLELAAAASSSLGVLALLAAAADETTTSASAAQLQATYFPWIDALTTLLDSHVDRVEDERSGDLSFVAHYPSAAATAARLGELTTRAITGARTLPHGERHVVLVAGMIAMHLSHPAASLPAAATTTRAVLKAADTLAMPLLLSVLSTWRRARPAR